LKKIIKGREPACQPQQPLKRRPIAGLARAIAARPRASGLSTAVVVGHLRSLLSLHLFPRCRDPREKPFHHRYLAPSHCSSLSLCAFAAAAPMSCQRCFPPSRRPPRHSSASFLLERGRPQATAPTVATVKATPEQVEAAHPLPPREAHRQSHVFRHPWPCCYSVELRACAILLHAPSAGAFDHRFIPLDVVPHHQPMSLQAVDSGETPSSHHPKSETPWPGLGPRPIPHWSSTTSQPDFVRDRWRRGREKNPLFLVAVGRKALWA
jgi:hypothetical protein